MDYFESDSFINPGLPKITTIPSATSTQQTQTPTPTSSASLNNTTNTIQIPTVDEVLSGTSQPPYTRNHFLQYLLQRHCLENLEFYLEIEKFLKLTNFIEKEYNWKFLFNNFIEVESPKEINLPASIRDNFQVDLIPSNQFLQDASKIVFDYLHEAYVGFIASREQELLSSSANNYCLTAPVPVSGKGHPNLTTASSSSSSSSHTAAAQTAPTYFQAHHHHSQQQQQQTLHLYDQQGRCISPLSPSESSRTTPLHKASAVISNDDNDFPFEMSDDDFDGQLQNQQSDERTLSKDRLTSNPILEENNQTQHQHQQHEDIITGRNSSISSSHSSSKFNIVGSFKGNDSNWKKLAKKLKWRRSSNSSDDNNI